MIIQILMGKAVFPQLNRSFLLKMTNLQFMNICQVKDTGEVVMVLKFSGETVEMKCI